MWIRCGLFSNGIALSTGLVDKRVDGVGTVWRSRASGEREEIEGVIYPHAVHSGMRKSRLLIHMQERPRKNAGRCASPESAWNAAMQDSRKSWVIHAIHSPYYYILRILHIYDV